MKSKTRVIVAMSGGVDSSVAAALLKEKGFEVVGITMCFNLQEPGGRKPVCCGLHGIEDARRVAHALDIRHYVVNMQKALQDKVIKDFCSEYLRGRTPNPCVRCNQFIKFDALLKKAISLDAQFLATGHYAKIARSSELGARRYLLRKAKDKFKDQSYFLYRLGQAQLKHILFPLGGYEKSEVRALARKFKLPVAEKPDSQEICFLPQGSYREFLKTNIKKEFKEGDIIDTDGNILGRHKGIAFYTVGQREGLGIAQGYPVYIKKIDVQKNRITVGSKDSACAREFLVKDIHFVGVRLQKKIVARVKIRYNHKEALADIEPQDSYIKVLFRKPQFAITPGQSAVFYKHDIVLGGGIIERILK